MELAINERFKELLLDVGYMEKFRIKARNFFI